MNFYDFHRPALLAGSAVAAVGLLCGPPLARTALAGTYGFKFATNDCGSGGNEPCAGNVVITTSSGQIQVVLTDTAGNPRSAGDLISNLEFTTSSGTGSPSLASQTGGLITVTSKTKPYTTTGGPPTHWEVGTSSGQIVLDTFSGAQPIDMIIGPPDASGNYSNANSSITNGNFSPYINGTGTFLINDSAITAGTSITGVTFTLGTMAGEASRTGTACTPGTPNCGSGTPVVPEPTSLALIGGALAMFGLLRHRRPKPI